MADVYTGAQDEETIRLVLQKGLLSPKLDKWYALRLALGLSLRMATPPDEELDRIEDREGGKEYHLQQLTGSGRKHAEGEQRLDYDDAVCSLLCVYHRQDLFADRATYRRLLQRHIRRGLREIRRGWRENHDFFEFLYQELFADSAGLASRSAPDLRDRLASALVEIGVKGDIQREREGPRVTRYFVRLPDINDLDRLRKGLDKLSFSLGLQQQGIMDAYTDESKVIGLDVPRPRGSWQTVSGSALRDWATGSVEGELPVFPGVDVLGEPFHLDLAQAPHLLIGGATGSGKSICLHALLLSLLWRQPARRLQLALIDPKRVELEPYNGLRNLVGGRVVSDSDEAVELLTGLVAEMEARTERLAELGVRDLAEGLRSGRLDLPYIVVVVEELADLFMRSRAAEEPLVRLAQLARATGIHLILATQRPDAETFSGLLRSNIPTRIALTVQKASESRIILDDTGAERLTGMGDMMVKAQGEVTRVHGVKIVADDIAAALAAARGRQG